MLRIAFNDAKETVHTASWPLKGLYSSTGKKKSPQQRWLHLSTPKGGPEIAFPQVREVLSSNSATPVMLEKAQH